VQIRRLGRVGYTDAWQQQRELHAQIVAGTTPDTVLLLEHDGVYTAGRRTRSDERPADPSIPVIDVDRGGKITWHGPGQLVGYPLLHLAEPLDVVSYVRRVEDVLIDSCTALGLETARVAGRSGVWTSDGARKIAAIGVRVARGVTMHGFALNADPDLRAYDRIVPCGITDAGVTSLTRELGFNVSVADVLPHLEERLPHLSGVFA
jgi:lipoyl(octanoyl) transferase